MVPSLVIVHDEGCELVLPNHTKVRGPRYRRGNLFLKQVTHGTLPQAHPRGTPPQLAIHTACDVINVHLVDFIAHRHCMAGRRGEQLQQSMQIFTHA